MVEEVRWCQIPVKDLLTTYVVVVREVEGETLEAFGTSAKEIFAMPFIGLEETKVGLTFLF